MQRRSAGGNPIIFVLRRRNYLFTFIAVSIIASAAYSYLLSGSAINLATPKIALGLNVYALSLSMLIGMLLSLSIVMNIFAASGAAESGASSGAKLGVSSIIANVIPLSLCCTWVVPALLAFFGASTFTVIGVTGALQGPFATYETAFIGGSLVLLLLSIFLASRNISACCRVKK